MDECQCPCHSSSEDSVCTLCLCEDTFDEDDD